MNRAETFLFAVVSFASALSTLCCPKECSCKWKNGKKMAECSDRGFISIPSGIEPETQMLDVSGNDLQVLQPDTFRNFGLVALQKMFVRSCRLGQIERNAFRGLENLIEIDLSNNLLTHVPSLAFDDVPYLRNISLANNPIQKLEAFAFAAVPQLAKLDLSNCVIQSVRPNAFDRLQLLDHLKLNDNELQQLPADTLQRLKRLRTVELHGNKWKCDCRTRALKIWTVETAVHIPIPLFCVGGPDRLKDAAISNLDSEDFACKPSIKTDARQLEPRFGSNVTLECRVESDPAARITWFFEKVHLSNNSTYDTGRRLVIVETVEKEEEEEEEYDHYVLEKRSKLILSSVQEGDGGEYHCVADNRAGSAEANFSLHPKPGSTADFVALGSGSMNVITVALGILIVLMLLIIVMLVKRIAYSSYCDDDAEVADDEEEDPKKLKTQLEKNASPETSSQQSQDSAMKSDAGKAFTVTSDLSYSRSLSDIGQPQFSNPDLISGPHIRDLTYITPLPITRPISDYCHNWQKSYVAPTRANSSSGFSYDVQDRVPMVMETGSAGSGNEEVFAHGRMSRDYPPDYGLPILPENGVSMQQPCAKTLKVWQRGVPVLPPMYSTPQHPPPMPVRYSIGDNYQAYRRCGTDV